VAHHEIARAHLARARAVLEHRRMRRIVVGLVLLVALVIVPFLLWGEALEEAVIPWIGAASHPAVAATLVALVMASDVLLPIPSSLVGVTAGALLGWPLGTVALAVGATLGCLVAYALGRLADEGLGRWVKPEDHARVDRFFSRYGRATLFLLRATPVLAEASVVAAGAARMPMRAFLLSCGFANVVLAIVYAAIGHWSVSTGWDALAIVGGLVVPGIAMLVAAWRAPRARG